MKTMSKSIMALILFIFVIVLVPIGIWPQESADLIGRIYDWMTMDYAWLFLLFGAGCCILALFFSFSRYVEYHANGVAEAAAMPDPAGGHCGPSPLPGGPVWDAVGCEPGDPGPQL